MLSNYARTLKDYLADFNTRNPLSLRVVKWLVYWTGTIVGVAILGMYLVVLALCALVIPVTIVLYAIGVLPST